MDNLPKLFPNWTDMAYQDLITTKTHSQYLNIKPPDYGGVGIDVNFGLEGLQCKSVKNNKNLINFAAETCSLPFLPVNFKRIADPCSEPICEEKENFKRFCVKLNGVRNQFKKAVCKIPKTKALQQSIAEIQKSGSYDPKLMLKVPKTFKHLVETFPEHVIIPNFNVGYIGGNSAVMKTDKYYLMHPFSEDQDMLCVTPLQYVEDAHFKPLLSDQKTLNIGNDNILQIDSSKHECCVIRTKASYFLLNLNKLELHSQKVKNDTLHYVASNPYNPLEVLSVYNRGKVKLRNMEFKKNIWQNSDYEPPDPGFLSPTWRCDFGSHPFSTLSMNENNLYAFDLREEDKPRDLFSIKDASFRLEEELTAMRRWDRNPFQHFLASTDHFLICDERYPKKSVLLWSHTLKDYPIYCDVADLQDSTNSVVIIGTQESQKAAAFFLEHSETAVTPVALGPPLVISSPSDCLDSLRFHAIAVNSRLSSHLAFPLTGISVQPHLDRNSFTVFQVTSAGDVFYQDFRETVSDPVERTYKVTTGCVLTPPEKILPSFEGCLVGEDALEKQVEDAKANAQMSVNIYNILNLPKEISSDCSLCRLSGASDQELVVSELCPGCNLNATQSSRFCKALTNLSAVIGPVSEEASSLEPDFEYLSQFKDEYSKRMLNVWINADENGESANPETLMEVDSSNIQHNPDISLNYSSLQNENMSILANSPVQTDSFDNTTFMESQDFDFVPPSQETRSLAGETIFLTAKSKHLLNRSKSSSAAGF